jgi:glycosyltransferase involved in cell wall biosynthesis
LTATRQDVTAIVPTYNRARYLGECLDALLAQTTPPREILVVDDGSTDDTAAIVAAYGRRIMYLRKENGGKSSALNLALTRATGAAIWIFDDDDVAEPGALAALCAALDSVPSAGFAFGGHDNFVDTPAGRRFIPAPSPHVDPDDLHCALLERCFIFQPALLVRRACYEAVGPFDTAFVRAQDYEMILRLSRHAAGVPVPRILFHQRQHAEMRGTAAHAIDGREVWERQKRFDAAVLEGAHRANSLADYLPRARQSAPLGPREQIDALLRRYAVMARKRLWALAVADLAQAADLARAYGIADVPPAETAMLRRVFDEFGYARDGLDTANPLLRQLDALPASPFPAAIRAALLWPLFRYALLAAWHRDGAAFRRHARLYRRFTDGRTLLRHATRLARRRPARHAG